MGKAPLKKYISIGLCLIFSVWGLYLRVLERISRDLWLDESNQLKNAMGPWIPFWKKHGFGDMTFFPGDYQLTYPFIMYFKEANKWGVVIPHIIATLIGLYLLYKLCSLYMKTPIGYGVTFLIVALNANLVFHAFELRAYAVLPTISLLMFYLFTKIFERFGELTRRRKILYAVLIMLCLWFNLAGMLIFVMLTVYFMLQKALRADKRRELKQPLKYLMIVLGLALPLWLFYATGNQIEYTFAGNISAGRHTFQYIPNPLVDFIGFLKGVFGNLIGKKPLYVLLAGLVLGFAVPTKERFKQIGFFLLLVALPVLITCMAATHQGYWFLQRQFVWTMPLFAFVLGWFWDTLYVFTAGKLMGSAVYEK